MALSRTAATLVRSHEAEYRDIEAWYREELAHTVPRVGLPWDPVKIGPTWQWSPGSGWLLPEASLGWRVLAWCGKWLRHNGQDWQFTMEQARFLLWFHAVTESGAPEFHSAVLQRLKGHGKDPLAACMATASCFAPVRFDHWDGDRPVGVEDPNAWVQIVAVSLDQTKNTMKLFPGLIPPETREEYGIQIGKQNVWGRGDTRQIEAVTSSPLAIEGGRPTLVVRTETQNWNSSNGGHDMAGALEGNAAKSPAGAARMLDICNAYRPGEDSVGERVREAWESTQANDDRDALIDGYGLMYDSLEAPPGAPLTADAAPAVIESIAGDSYWLDTAPGGRIVKSIMNPANPASESRRKWYNQIEAAEDAWAVRREWDDPRNLRRGEVVDDDERIFAFFDGSKGDDSTVLIGCRISDGLVFKIGAWQKPPRMQRGERWLVNRELVDARVDEMFTRWRPIGFWADPSDARDDDTGERYWEPYIDGWAKRYGHHLQDMPAVKSGPQQHLIIWDMRNPVHARAFTEAAERTASDITDGRLLHDGNEILRQHVCNARRRPNQYGVSLGKMHRESAKKVDAAVGMVGARLMWRRWMQSNKRGRAPGKGRAVLL